MALAPRSRRSPSACRRRAGPASTCRLRRRERPARRPEGAPGVIMPAGMELHRAGLHRAGARARSAAPWSARGGGPHRTTRCQGRRIPPPPGGPVATAPRPRRRRPAPGRRDAPGHPRQAGSPPEAEERAGAERQADSAAAKGSAAPGFSG
jgi:hypothetical protein